MPAMRPFRAPRWLPGGNAADHLAGAVLDAAPPTAAADLPARALGHARRRLHRRRFRRRAGDRRAPRRCWCCSTASKARREPLRAGLRALGARRAAGASAVPHFRGCSGELNLGAARLPLGRLRGDRLDPGAPARARTARPLFAVGVSLGGNALLRWAEEAGDTRRRHGARGGRGLLADRPGGRRPRHRPRLQPAGLHAHVPAHHEAEGAGASWRSTRACSTASGCSPRATCTSSTTSSPRRCTAFATPTTTGRAPRPSRTCAASAFRRWCSMRATTPSCPRPACRARTRSAACVTLWQPAHGGHVGFPRGAFRATC